MKGVKMVKKVLVVDDNPDVIFSVRSGLEEFTKDYATDKTINMTLTGGTKVVKYFGSLAYFNEGDILNIGDYGQGYSPNFAFNRVNFRSNTDFDITPTTRFSANLSGYHSESRRPGGDKFRGWPYLYSSPPDLWPAQYSDGTWADYALYERFANGIYKFNSSFFKTILS